jgi:hypothetical protein
MIKQLFYKWFGLTDVCQTCEVLREQLARSERERIELLHKLIDAPKPSIEPVSIEEPQAITPQFIPWRVRQQMLEAEDRKRAELTKAKEKEINELEKQLGIPQE